MAKLLNSIYLGASTPSDYGNFAGGVELLPYDYYLGAATPSTGPSYIDVLLSGVSPLVLTNALELNYLKLFGGTEQRNLPSEYTQVEYLESSGTQYIDTGIKPNSNTAISIKYYPAVSSVFMCLYGIQDSTSLNRFYGLISVTQFRVQVNSNAGSTPSFWGINKDGTLVTNTNGTFAQTHGTVTLVVDNKNKLISVKSDEYTGNISASDTVLGDNLNCQYNMLLLSRGTAGTPANNFSGRLYSFTIKENDVLIQNLIPCRRNSDSVLGMYDTVTGNFLTNQGTGTFTAGADAVPTPDTPMDIVSNNGVVKYGYKSVNMFDKNSTLEDGIVWVNNGNITPLSDYYGTNQIHVIGGHTYTRSGSHGNANYIKLSDGTWATFNDGARTITMPDNAILWAFNNKAATSRDTMMVVEGTSLPAEYVPYEGYGIYTDGTVETVEVHGKNLFNKDDSTNWGGWYPANGVIASSTAANRTLVMRCQPNTTYYFKHCVYTGGLRAFYVEDENYADGSPYASSVGTTQGNANTVYSITTSANAKWLFVCFARLSGSVSATLEEQASDYILSTEVLTSDTPYIPYYYGGSATAEMLLKVGDYKDEQSVIDGSVTRNVGIKVLDGTENWSTGSAANPNRYTLTAAFNDLADLTDNNIGYSNCYTVISRSTSIQSSLQNNECGWNTTKVFCVRDDRIATLADWKQFLADQYNAGTPVIIVYPLATPTTSSVTAQPLTVQQGTNIVTITQASIDNLTMELSYKQEV